VVSLCCVFEREREDQGGKKNGKRGSKATELNRKIWHCHIAPPVKGLAVSHLKWSMLDLLCMVLDCCCCLIFVGRNTLESLEKKKFLVDTGIGGGSPPFLLSLVSEILSIFSVCVNFGFWLSSFFHQTLLRVTSLDLVFLTFFTSSSTWMRSQPPSG